MPNRDDYRFIPPTFTVEPDRAPATPPTRGDSRAERVSYAIGHAVWEGIAYLIGCAWLGTGLWGVLGFTHAANPAIPTLPWTTAALAVFAARCFIDMFWIGHQSATKKEKGGN